MFNPRQAVWTKELEVSCSTESEWVQPWIDRFVQDCAALLSRVQFAHVERAVALDCVLDCRTLTMDGDRMYDIDDTLETAAVGIYCPILTVSFRSSQAFYAGVVYCGQSGGRRREGGVYRVGGERRGDRGSVALAIAPGVPRSKSHLFPLFRDNATVPLFRDARVVAGNRSGGLRWQYSIGRIGA